MSDSRDIQAEIQQLLAPFTGMPATQAVQELAHMVIAAFMRGVSLSAGLAVDERPYVFVWYEGTELMCSILEPSAAWRRAFRCLGWA